MQKRLEGTQTAPGEIEIPPDELTSFSIFIALGTQWRICAMTGQRLGLDYSVIPATAEMLGTPMDPHIFRDLRVMEREALDALMEVYKR
jgi:hypothetical protein